MKQKSEIRTQSAGTCLRIGNRQEIQPYKNDNDHEVPDPFRKIFYRALRSISDYHGADAAHEYLGADPSETFSALVRSTRGQVLIVAVVLLSALYPKFGFIRRQEIGSLRKNREQILNAFVSEGFKPVRESEHEMVFRADSLFKRLTLLFEDEIRVTQTGSGSRSKVSAEA